MLVSEWAVWSRFSAAHAPLYAVSTGRSRCFLGFDTAVCFLASCCLMWHIIILGTLLHPHFPLLGVSEICGPMTFRGVVRSPCAASPRPPATNSISHNGLGVRFSTVLSDTSGWATTFCHPTQCFTLLCIMPPPLVLTKGCSGTAVTWAVSPGYLALAASPLCSPPPPHVPCP